MSDLDNATLVGIYETMTTIRQCEEKVHSLLMAGQIMIMCHAPWGQEAIAAGIGSLLRPDDYVVTTYRGMHDQIAKGVPLPELWAEYLGKATGTCKGKGGPMHITHPESGLVVTTGIVGSGIPIANGFALASQMRGTDQVTMCSFGDGATNIGAFHEALNMASVWSLPVVFVCQNNLWAEHTAIAEYMPIERVADRAASYGMPGVTVDGKDPIAVRAVASAAIDRARSGGGPTLVEAVADRVAGHFVGDSQHYVPKEFLDAATAADPVPAFRTRLIEELGVSEDEIRAVEERVEADLTAAVTFAMDSPFPGADALKEDVYAEAVAR